MPTIVSNQLKIGGIGLVELIKQRITCYASRQFLIAPAFEVAFPSFKLGISW